MFTGIVEALGTVAGITAGNGRCRIEIDAGSLSDDMAIGDSIAVNGVCLTAVAIDGPVVAVEAVDETLDRSNLSDLEEGSAVDLERPMRAGGRFDGHIVQGHVDGTAAVRSIDPEGASKRFWFDVPRGLLKYLVEKGSVTVDGISLTVSAVDEGGFEVVIIPHTLDATVLGGRTVGERVNLEVDVLAKYVERLLEARTS